MRVTREKVLLLLQSALCVVVAALLVAAVVGIYADGVAARQQDSFAWIYTREKVGAALAPVVLPLLLSVAMTIVCCVLGIDDAKAKRPVEDIELTRDLLRRRLAEPDEAVLSEQKLQRRLQVGGWAGFGLCMVPVALYMSNQNNFQNGDLEEMISGVALHVLPWVALALGALVVSTILRGKSMQRECDAIKACTGKGRAAKVQVGQNPLAPAADHGRLRGVLLVVAVAFVVLGVLNGSMDAVINKAIRICTECVGLG